MKISKKKITIAVIMLLIAACVGWRLWSHALADVVSADMNSVSSFTCSASIGSVSDGASMIEGYTLNSSTIGKDGFLEIIKILNSTSYHQDFRNLLPWPVTTVATDGSTRSATINFAWGTAATESCIISFLDDKTISFNLGVNDGFLIYHPTDRTTLNRLVDFIQLHGTSN